MEPLEEMNYYHIYNRGAGKASIFFNEYDYRLFIEKYFYYLFVSAETYAWCLLENHFHLMIRVRSIEEQYFTFKNIKSDVPKYSFYGDHYNSPKPYSVSKQLSHLFNSYTKTINSKSNRSGTLIEGSFKRKKIMDENHLLHIICYIHRNPIHHRITANYSDYPYSSYQHVLYGDLHLIDSETTTDRFGGTNNYISAHNEFKQKLGEDFYLE
jgi:REP element-mobilizing transposase RayT